MNIANKSGKRDRDTNFILRRVFMITLWSVSDDKIAFQYENGAILV